MSRRRTVSTGWHTSRPPLPNQPLLNQPLLSQPLPTRKRRYALDPARRRPDWPPRGAPAKLAGRPRARSARRPQHRGRCATPTSRAPQASRSRPSGPRHPEPAAEAHELDIARRASRGKRRRPARCAQARCDEARRTQAEARNAEDRRAEAETTGRTTASRGDAGSAPNPTTRAAEDCCAEAEASSASDAKPAPHTGAGTATSGSNPGPVAARTAQPPPASTPAGPSVDLPNFGVVATVVVLIAAAVLPLLALGAASSATIAEAGYVVRAFAASEIPGALASTSVADRLLGVYASATGAFTGDGSPVLAGRVPMLLAAAVGVGLVYLLGRHLTHSRVTAVVAAVLFGLSPLSITLHRMVDPANLAIPCMLAAILLAASATKPSVTRRGRFLVVGLAAVLTLLALLIAPMLLVVVPTVGWFAWEALRPTTRDRVVDAVAPAAMAVAWLVTYLLVRSGVGSTGLGSGPESISLDVLIGPDPVFVVLSILTASGALLLGRLRVVSATLLVLVLLCFFPGSASRVSAAIAAVPFAALVIPSAVEAAWLHWREVTSEESARLRRLGPAIVVGLLVVLALPIWLVRLGPEVASRSDGDPARAVADFLASEVSDDEAVLVDDATWVVLARASDDLTARMPYDAVRSGGSFVRSGLDPSLAVAAEGVRDERLRDFLDRSRPLAAFGPLVIRQVTQSATQNRPDKPADAERDTAAVTRTGACRSATCRGARRTASAGADLLRNSKLIAEPPAVAALEQGQVDPRLLSVLVSAIFSQTIRVADFPAARGEEGTDAARRTAIITQIDGAPVDANGEATEKLVRFLQAQLPTYRPADVSVSLTGSSLTIRYDAPSPVGLLARGT